MAIAVLACLVILVAWTSLGGKPVLDGFFAAPTVDPASLPENVRAFVGTYHLASTGSTPVGPSDEREDLILSSDMTARIIRQPVEKGGQTQVSTGIWKVENLRAMAQFMTINGKPMQQPVRMVFEIQDLFLVATEHPFGSQPYIFSFGSGGQNPLVRGLHQRLASLSWLNYADPGPEGSAYSTETRLAIEVFQSSQGLPPTGVMDQATWQALANPAPPGQAGQMRNPQSAAQSLAPTAAPVIVIPGEGWGVIRQGPPTDAAGLPLVYLTFDDGPDPLYTPQVLDLLRQYGAHATFFVIGRNAARYPDLLKSEIDAGDDVANHTYNHRSLVGLAAEDFGYEVETTGRVIQAAAASTDEPQNRRLCLRPPFDRYDTSVTGLAAQYGYQLTLWSIDPNDWRRPGAAAIAGDVTSKVFPGAIILLHDGGGDRTQTVQALGMILRSLSQQGYRFASICHPLPK